MGVAFRAYAGPLTAPVPPDFTSHAISSFKRYSSCCTPSPPVYPAVLLIVCTYQVFTHMSSGTGPENPSAATNSDGGVFRGQDGGAPPPADGRAGPERAASLPPRTWSASREDRLAIVERMCVHAPARSTHLFGCACIRSSPPASATTCV